MSNPRYKYLLFEGIYLATTPLEGFLGTSSMSGFATSSALHHEGLVAIENTVALMLQSMVLSTSSLLLTSISTYFPTVLRCPFPAVTVRSICTTVRNCSLPGYRLTNAPLGSGITRPGQLYIYYLRCLCLFFCRQHIGYCGSSIFSSGSPLSPPPAKIYQSLLATLHYSIRSSFSM